MKVSIITAVRNGFETVADAIASVEEQEYSDIEHVLIDGASTDGTAGFVLGMRRHDRIVVSESDEGVYDALNKGMQLSTGDIIGVLHADDFFRSPAVITRVVDVMKREGVDLVYGDVQYVRRNSPLSVIRFWKSGEFAAEALRYGWMPPHPTVFIRRRLLDLVGAYDTSFHIAADYDFLLRILTRTDIRCAYLPEVLVSMRLGGVSNGSLQGVMRKSREDLRAVRSNRVGGVPTVLMKNLRKLPQFLIRT